MCIIYTTKRSQILCLGTGLWDEDGFPISDRRLAFPTENAGLRFMRPRRQPHTFQFITHNVHIIQYNIGLTQGIKKHRWINKVIITVLSQVMSHILIVLHVFVAVSDAHKPTKDSSCRWRQRSSEPLKSAYQTTRCRIEEDRNNGIANIENI
jgi:hypothetical protein